MIGGRNQPPIAQPGPQVPLRCSFRRLAATRYIHTITSTAAASHERALRDVTSA